MQLHLPPLRLAGPHCGLPSSPSVYRTRQVTARRYRTLGPSSKNMSSTRTFRERQTVCVYMCVCVCVRVCVRASTCTLTMNQNGWWRNIHSLQLEKTMLSNRSKLVPTGLCLANTWQACFCMTRM